MVKRLLAIALLLLSVNAHAWTISTHFDSCDDYCWDGTGTASIVSSESAPGSSSNSLQIFNPQNAGDSSVPGGAAFYFTATNEFWAQTWFKYKSNFDFHQGNNKLIYLQNSSNASNLIVIDSSFGSSFKIWPLAVAGQTWYDPNITATPIVRDTWYKLVFHIQVNGPGTDIFEYWLNDVKQAYYSNATLAPSSNPTFNRMNLDPVWGGQGDSGPGVDNYQWFDHVIISTDPIGGGGGDGSPPYVDTFSPSDGATGVSQGTTSASFYWKDAGDGANIATLDVGGLGCASCASCDAGLTCSGTSANYTITRTGLSFNYDDVFSEVITGADLAGNWMASRTFNFTVTSDPGPGSPSITTTTVATGTVGTAASTSFAATGGTSPYTWSVLSGTLPPGKTLSSGGTYSGTPTDPAGTYNFTVGIVDAISGTDNQALSQIISAAVPGGQITDNVTTIADTFINSGATTTNYADNTRTESYQWPAYTVANRQLYDITLGLPDNVSILSATLYLYKESHEGSGGTDPMNLYAYRTGSQTISTVTWATFDNTLQTYESVTAVPLTVGWNSFSVTTMAQWAYANASHLFVAIDGKQDGASDSNRIFTSMEGTAGYTPYLSITYMQLVAPGGPSISAPGKFRISSGRFRAN